MTFGCECPIILAIKESESKKPAHEVVFERYSRAVLSVRGTYMIVGNTDSNIKLLEEILSASVIPEDYQQHILEVSDSLTKSAQTNITFVERQLIDSINKVRQSLSTSTD